MGRRYSNITSKRRTFNKYKQQQHSEGIPYQVAVVMRNWMDFATICPQSTAEWSDLLQPHVETNEEETPVTGIHSLISTHVHLYLLFAYCWIWNVIFPFSHQFYFLHFVVYSSIQVTMFCFCFHAIPIPIFVWFIIFNAVCNYQSIHPSTHPSNNHQSEK